ncbi:MAG: hypothetical protein GU343_01285, partial [Nanoarchaeota archaeon]|nr:hypothetical protein [Nanoarchaeota archaeon]
MKKYIYVFLLILLFFSIKSLQINITKISPTIVNTNNNINLEVCIVNNGLSQANLINLNIYYPNCIYSNQSSIYVPYLNPGDYYCTSLNLYENCNPGSYNIIINGSYTNNNGVSEISQIYPIFVENLPYITISNYYYANNYYGSIANLILNITNYGEEIYNVLIQSNFSICSLEPSSIYLSNLSGSTLINFQLLIPSNYANNYYGSIANLILNITNYGEEIYNVLIQSNFSICSLEPSSIYLSNLSGSTLINFQLLIPSNYANNYCTIPLFIIYQDPLGNINNYTTFINVPILPSNNRLEVLYNVGYLNTGENIINLTLYNPTNSNISDISLTFIGTNISIANNNIYINNIMPGQEINIPITVIVNNNLYGTITIPFNIQYYSNSILYNLNGYIVENIN